VRGLRIGLLLLAVAGLGGFNPAAAGDSAGRFALKGVGIATCAQFITAESQRAEAYHAFLAWLDGYASAINAVRDDTFDIAAWRSSALIAQIIKRNCSERPQIKFGVIAQRVYRQLGDQALAQASDMVPVGAGDDRFLIYQATIEAVQRRLRQAGFGQVEVTGVHDSATQAALSEFQARAGLRVSSLPDQVTLWRLFSTE